MWRPSCLVLFFTLNSPPSVRIGPSRVSYPLLMPKPRPAQPAGNALLAQFNDTAMFVKVPGKDWAYLGEYVTTACGQAVPAPVLSSWGMCT